MIKRLSSQFSLSLPLLPAPLCFQMAADLRAGELQLVSCEARLEGTLGQLCLTNKRLLFKPEDWLQADKVRALQRRGTERKGETAGGSMCV